MLCTPLLDVDGNVIGAIEVVNKRGNSGKFTDDDCRNLAALASHVAIALDDINRSANWEEVLDRSNPLLDALKAHQHTYTRFSSSTSKPSYGPRRVFDWITKK